MFARAFETYPLFKKTIPDQKRRVRDLETASKTNVDIYTKMGFGVDDVREIDGIKTWSMTMDW